MMRSRSQKKELTWSAKLAALVVKDLRVELRTRYSLNALIMFALVTLFALGVTFTGQILTFRIHAALIWIMIYFSGLQGLSGGFVKEEEARTAMALRLYAPSSVIFFGKLVFSLLILTILVVFLFPLYYILMNPEIKRFWIMLLVLILGIFGLSATSTITAAMVSKANVKGALFAVLSFPLMLPLLLIAISATSVCLGGGDGQTLWDSLKILIAYPVIVTAVSFLLFDYVWNN
jgi:heme exporter protein B